MRPFLKVANPGIVLNLLLATILFQLSSHIVVDTTFSPLRKKSSWPFNNFISTRFHSPTGFTASLLHEIRSYKSPALCFFIFPSGCPSLSKICISGPVSYGILYFVVSSCTQNMIPLLPPFEIFHSSFKSKFSNSSSVAMSPPFLIFPFSLSVASRYKAPSALFQAEPQGPPPYLCQPFVVFPSNNVTQSFACTVFVESVCIVSVLFLLS